MDKLFLTILNMSLTGSFIIVVVIFARLPLKKAPKIISYCLWAVVGFRLICPFTVESVFSLLPFHSNPVSENILVTDADVSFTGALLDSMRSPFDETITSLNPEKIDVDDNRYYEAQTTRYLFGYEAQFILASYIYPFGFTVMLVYGIVSYILIKRRMRTAIRIEGNVYETDNIMSPFVLGMIKPKIYLPLSLVSSEHEYIILHEQTHIRRKDHITKFAAYSILSLHWFNPLVWVAFLLMGIDMEMSCDEFVLKKTGGETKHDYSRSLLSFATEKRIISGSPLTFGEGGMKGRVKNVLNFRRPSQAIIVAAVILVAVLSLGLATNRTSGKQPFNDLKADEIASILLYCIPPSVTVTIEERSTIDEIAAIMRTVTTYEEDNYGELYAGQLVQYTLTMQSGETIEIGALGSFIYIDGQRYKAKYEPSEELNYLGNQLCKEMITPYHQALDVINERYPEATEIISTGFVSINYTEPPIPVEVYTFEIVVDGERIICAVSKDSKDFFIYNSDSGTWFDHTGTIEWGGATLYMSLDDVRAIAKKIGPDLTLGNLRDYIGTDIGSGRYIMVYEVDGGKYMLTVNSGGIDDTNVITEFGRVIDGKLDKNVIDIRYHDVEEYITDGTRKLVRPLPEQKETFAPESRTASTTLHEGFYQIVLKLFELDAGLNDGIKYIAVDMAGVFENERKPLESDLRLWAESMGLVLLIGSYDDLVESGHITPIPLKNEQITGEEGFLDGILFTFRDGTFEGFTLTINATKYRGPLGAVGSVFTASFENGSWTVNEPEQIWMA